MKSAVLVTPDCSLALGAFILIPVRFLHPKLYQLFADISCTCNGNKNLSGEIKQ